MTGVLSKKEVRKHRDTPGERPQWTRQNDGHLEDKERSPREIKPADTEISEAWFPRLSRQISVVEVTAL